MNDQNRRRDDSHPDQPLDWQSDALHPEYRRPVTQAAIDGAKKEMIDAGLTLLALEHIEAAVLKVPGTEPQLWAAIGAPESIRKLLPAVESSTAGAAKGGNTKGAYEAWLLAAPQAGAGKVEVPGSLLETVRKYADRDNWVEDDRGVKRVWMEPDSSSPMEYDGFTLAEKVLAASPPAPVAEEGKSNMLRDDTASQSQAVPSELASLQRYEMTKDYLGDGEYSYFMADLPDGEFVRFGDVLDIFSHSAATGKVPEAYSKAMRDMIRVLRGVQCGDDSQWKFIANVCENAEELLASPAAPLAAAVPAEEAKFEPSRASRIELSLRQIIEADDDQALTQDLIEAGRKALKLIPAEPAPIQASALTDDEIKVALEAHGVPFGEPYVYSACKVIEREVLARLSKPTARPNADCSRDPSNCPDNEGYGCECGTGVPTAQGAAQSIADVKGFENALFHYTQELNNPRGSLRAYAEAKQAFVSFINRHIAAQAPAGRDAQIEWTPLEQELPEANRVVWVLRQYSSGKKVVYLGKRRNNNPLTRDPDTSRNDWWSGIEPSGCSWSDTSTLAWAPYAPPTVSHAAEQTEGKTK